VGVLQGGPGVESRGPDAHSPGPCPNLPLAPTRAGGTRHAGASSAPGAVAGPADSKRGRDSEAASPACRATGISVGRDREAWRRPGQAATCRPRRAGQVTRNGAAAAPVVARGPRRAGTGTVTVGSDPGQRCGSEQGDLRLLVLEVTGGPSHYDLPVGPWDLPWDSEPQGSVATSEMALPSSNFLDYHALAAQC
jgi:hypothetical protein